MRINGVPFPSGMTLTDFFAKAKQGQLDSITGALSNPNLTEDNGRLDFFTEALNPNTAVANPEKFTINTNDMHVVDALNNATDGNAFADFYSKVTSPEDLSGGILEDVFNSYNDYGLPLWYARMKGLIK